MPPHTNAHVFAFCTLNTRNVCQGLSQKKNAVVFFFLGWAGIERFWPGGTEDGSHARWAYPGILISNGKRRTWLEVSFLLPACFFGFVFFHPAAAKCSPQGPRFCYHRNMSRSSHISFKTQYSIAGSRIVWQTSVWVSYLPQIRLTQTACPVTPQNRFGSI